MEIKVKKLILHKLREKNNLHLRAIFLLHSYFRPKQYKSSYLLSKTNSTTNRPISMRIAIIRVRVNSIEPGRLKSPLK